MLGVVLDRDEDGRLLETLAVYQREKLSLNRAAKLLHVHPNTITYRVRQVLEITGETDAGSLRLRAAVALSPLTDNSTTPDADEVASHDQLRF